MAKDKPRESKRYFIATATGKTGSATRRATDGRVGTRCQGALQGLCAVAASLHTKLKNKA